MQNINKSCAIVLSACLATACATSSNNVKGSYCKLEPDIVQRASTSDIEAVRKSAPNTLRFWNDFVEVVAQSVPPNSPEYGAARSILDVIHFWASKDNYWRFGFLSLDEARGSDLGEPLELLIVRCQDLKDYQKSNKTSPKKFTRYTNFEFWPIITQNQARNFIKIEYGFDGWRFAGFNSSVLADVEQLRRSRVILSPKSKSFSLLTVLIDRDIYFLMERSGKDYLLTPVMDYPSYGLLAGDTQTIQTVFDSLGHYVE